MATESNDLNGFILGGHTLAAEIISHLLKFCDFETLLACRLVCRQWSLTISDPFFWKQLCLDSKGRQPWIANKAANRTGVFMSKLKQVVYNTFFPQKMLGLSDLEISSVSLPAWTVYAIILKHQPFDRNLIENPCGKDGKNHWEILSEGGDGIACEQPPSGSNSVPHEAENEIDSLNACFATSYHSCSKEQVVDLSQIGLNPNVINELRPSITFTDWFAGRWDCGCQYECLFSLLDESKKVLVQHKYERTLTEAEGKEWFEVSHSFKNYPDGVRYARFYHGGMDTKFWAGHYGVKLTGSSIKISLM